MNSPKLRRPKAVHSQPLTLSDLTELALSKRFVDRHKQELRYCSEWKTWLTFDGQRWCRTTLHHEHLAKETIEALRVEAERLDDPGEQIKIGAALSRCESASTIAATTRLAKSDPEIGVSASKLDQGSLLLNCSNGTLDLATGELRPHQAKDFLTRVAPVAYHPDASCPTWDGFLERIMGGEVEMIDYLRRVAGYALSGSTEEHCLCWLNGRGRNGKSVFINTLLRVVGDDYGMTAANHLLSAASQEHPTALADLEGKRIVAVSEPASGKLDENLVKVLTGGENVRARRMHQDNREFPPSHKLFITANHKPDLRGTDDGIWSRMRLVLFPVSIPAVQQDKGLDKKLMAEAPGILAWMVRGCMEWQQIGLGDPSAVIQATQSHRDDASPVKDFLASTCERGDAHRCGTTDLFKAYERWCYSQGLRGTDRLNSRSFGEAIELEGGRRFKSGSMYWGGLALKGCDCVID